MQLSRLVLAFVLALRSVLVYGEATRATAAEMTWRDVLPAPSLPSGGLGRMTAAGPSA